MEKNLTILKDALDQATKKGAFSLNEVLLSWNALADITEHIQVLNSRILELERNSKNEN